MHTYGTNNYNLEFSNYKELDKYKLIYPIKTELKNQFGNVINEIVLLQWNYICLNWFIDVDDKTKLQIEHTISEKNKKVNVYKSKTYNLIDSNLAIKDFKKYVNKHKNDTI